VQRLAVHPDAQRHGIGRALLLDGLHWMRRRGVRRAVVNTQLGNDAALNLYRTIGFHHEPSKLSVLSAGLT
jgi:ribosomal protein S18 acetylase RimI-like enzyme